jgi:hypothetical protein
MSEGKWEGEEGMNKKNGKWNGKCGLRKKGKWKM